MVAVKELLVEFFFTKINYKVGVLYCMRNSITFVSVVFSNLTVVYTLSGTLCRVVGAV